MHWTALLAYRRQFPRGARVIDDVACIGCGYNLRGLSPTGLCPECGRAASDSLYVLARPDVVAANLRTVAVSYLAGLSLVLGCVGFWVAAAWLPLVLAGIVAIGSFWRVFGLAQIRYRGEIRRLPVLGDRFDLLWLSGLVEFAAALLRIAALVVAGRLFATQPALAERIMLTSGLVWVVSLLLNVAAAGWFGVAMAGLLGYGWMRIEFKLQLAWVAFAALVLSCQALVRPAASTPAVATIAWVLATLVWCGMILLTTVPLLQAANGAEGEDEVWEEVIG